MLPSFRYKIGIIIFTDLSLVSVFNSIQVIWCMFEGGVFSYRPIVYCLITYFHMKYSRNVIYWADVPSKLSDDFVLIDYSQKKNCIFIFSLMYNVMARAIIFRIYDLFNSKFWCKCSLFSVSCALSTLSLATGQKIFSQWTILLFQGRIFFHELPYQNTIIMIHEIKYDH